MFLMNILGFKSPNLTIELSKREYLNTQFWACNLCLWSLFFFCGFNSSTSPLVIHWKALLADHLRPFFEAKHQAKHTHTHTNPPQPRDPRWSQSEVKNPQLITLASKTPSKTHTHTNPPQPKPKPTTQRPTPITIRSHKPTTHHVGEQNTKQNTHTHTNPPQPRDPRWSQSEVSNPQPRDLQPGRSQSEITNPQPRDPRRSQSEVTNPQPQDLHPRQSQSKITNP